MNRLLGKNVLFVPNFLIDKNGDVKSDLAKPIRGTIVCVHKQHQWFTVSYKVGDNELRESFKFDDIGKAVKVFGK